MATKKKALKLMKAIAAKMPLLQETKNILGERVEGSELVKSGVTELKDGTPVDPEFKYKKKTPVTGPVDHVKKMKQMYKKYGAAGINGYIDGVNDHVRKKIKDAKTTPPADH